MPQTTTNYPLDYSRGPRESAQSERSRPTDSAIPEQLQNAADKAQEVASQLTEQAQEYAQKAQEAAKNFKPFMEKSMKDQPMATLAAASVIGFVLGALWKK